VFYIALPAISTTASGTMTSETVTVFSIIQMEKDTMANGLTTKSTVTVFTIFPVAINMMVSGAIISETDMER
jgi:hypothetical protein